MEYKHKKIAGQVWGLSPAIGEKMKKISIIIALFLIFSSGCSHYDPCGVDIDQLAETSTGIVQPHISGSSPYTIDREEHVSGAYIHY